MDSSDEDDGLDVVVGLRVIGEDGESQMRKLKLHCEPTVVVNVIRDQVNETLEKAGLGLRIENLVPLWTPTWDPLEGDKKMIKVLKHSENGAGDPFDARGMDPVRMVGVDAEEFDDDFWNHHLDFRGEEFEWLEATSL
eukprot:TRINITY_DN31269_c0_g1_i1.p1 TRINITY_DN31269_c0_g1~~TRINITY_DN31269_c0_g1_i1.p1  ORF type:complete len:138 (-),score=29.21 TRINITY_DN31269_c0_g1_i1:82-495(-)